MIVLITGGASGLGEALTRKIAADSKHMVYFTYNNSLDNAQKIEREFSNVSSIYCNYEDEMDLDSLTNKVGQLNIDVLINNAYTGTFLKSHFHKTSSEDFLTNFNKNVIPTIKITQAAINCFRKKKFGKIITILTSALVNTPPIGSSVYIAGKAYLEQLTKVWATENSNFNITSNSVSPDFMLTSFTKEIDERVVEQITEKHPLKKILTTEEVAETVSFLLNTSQQINGIDMVINSGANIK